MRTRTIPRKTDTDTIKRCTELHYQGWPCSRIDWRLSLEPGTAKHAVMSYWQLSRDDQKKIMP